MCLLDSVAEITTTTSSFLSVNFSTLRGFQIFFETKDHIVWVIIQLFLDERLSHSGSIAHVKPVFKFIFLFWFFYFENRPEECPLFSDFDLFFFFVFSLCVEGVNILTFSEATCLQSRWHQVSTRDDRLRLLVATWMVDLFVFVLTEMTTIESCSSSFYLSLFSS